MSHLLPRFPLFEPGDGDQLDPLLPEAFRVHPAANKDRSPQSINIFAVNMATTNELEFIALLKGIGSTYTPLKRTS